MGKRSKGGYGLRTFVSWVFLLAGVLLAIVSMADADELFNDVVCRAKTLTESNFDDFISDAIDSGKTAFVRFIASRG